LNQTLQGLLPLKAVMAVLVMLVTAIQWTRGTRPRVTREETDEGSGRE
jgi:hypothetical protein